LENFVTFDSFSTTADEKAKIKASQELLKQVQLLHKNKIVHTDLKGNNVMINPITNEVRIIDFGTAIVNTGKRSYEKTRGFSKFVVSPAFKGSKKESFARFVKNDMWGLGNLIFDFLRDGYPMVNNPKQISQVNKWLQSKLNTSTTFYYLELAK
jgi:serine/threonine protein kinase